MEGGGEGNLGFGPGRSFPRSLEDSILPPLSFRLDGTRGGEFSPVTVAFLGSSHPASWVLVTPNVW